MSENNPQQEQKPQKPQTGSNLTPGELRDKRRAGGTRKKNPGLIIALIIGVIVVGVIIGFLFLKK